MRVSYVKFKQQTDGGYSLYFQDVGSGKDKYDSLPKTFGFDLYYNPVLTTEKDVALDLLIHSCKVIEEQVDNLYKTKALLEKAYTDYLNKDKE